VAELMKMNRDSENVLHAQSVFVAAFVLILMSLLTGCRPEIKPEPPYVSDIRTKMEKLQIDRQLRIISSFGSRHEDVSALYVVAMVPDFVGDEVDAVGRLAYELLLPVRAMGARIVDDWPHGMTDPPHSRIPFRRYSLYIPDGPVNGRLTISTFRRLADGESELWYSIEASGIRHDK
jgi:hypothetical protein